MEQFNIIAMVYTHHELTAVESKTFVVMLVRKILRFLCCIFSQLERIAIMMVLEERVDLLIAVKHPDDVVTVVSIRDKLSGLDRVVKSAGYV
jgi:hypothetical protein